jgi:ligand-binding sensor domain-containing protein/AraC-like DNA-binding protein
MIHFIFLLFCGRNCLGRQTSPVQSCGFSYLPDPFFFDWKLSFAGLGGVRMSSLDPGFWGKKKKLKVYTICFIILYSKGETRKMKSLGDSGLTKAIVIFIILIQFYCSPIWGLTPDKTVDQYLVDQWQTADGIPSNEIHAIAQTPDGYLWIATIKGLVRFDGMEFSIISFASKEEIGAGKTFIPSALFVDWEGTLWIGSSVGLTSFDYRTNRFNTFTSINEFSRDRIRRIVKDLKGNLWISLWDGYVNRFSVGKFTEFNTSHGLEGKRINAIVENKKGNLLFATREKGIFEYKDDKFLKYPVEGLDGHIILFMYEDRKGDLWIGTNKRLFRVTDQRVETFTIRDGLSDNYITYILEDNEHNLWIGTLKGLNRIKKNRNGKVIFEHGLKNLTITYLFEDREKSLWIGTYKSGIQRLKDGKFISYAPIEDLPEKILFSIFEDPQGKIWIGAVDGKLSRFRDNILGNTIKIPELSGTGIFAIEVDEDGDFWLGTNGKGVFQWKNGTFIQKTTRQGLADNMVTSIYKDTRGNLWFSTFDGVSVRYPDGLIKSFTSRNGLAGKEVHNVYEDKNHNIFIASDLGLTVLNSGKLSKQNAAFYLQGISVIRIYEDLSAPKNEGGIFWITTHGAGLKRLRLKDGNITSYTVDDGMITNSLFQFFEDSEGCFWLMSDSGILHVDKEELNRFARRKLDKINCISYGISDGMKSIEFTNRKSRHSALKTRNGELWFITKEGISIVNPEKTKISKIPPPVVIEAVYLDQQSLPLHQGPTAYSFKGIKSLQFHFTAPTFLSPKKTKFKYRLEGYDEDWIFLPPGSGRMAHYWNLSPGSYTFRVIASNAEGVWNQSGDAITFTLKPFFYQTLFFKIAVPLLFAVLLGSAVYIYKKHHFKKKGKEKEVEKYKGSTLDLIFAEECINKLKHLMEVEKIYRDENITLQSMAKTLSIHPHLLSRILNEKLNRNFFNFINYYRIEETKEILRSPAGGKKKINNVAHDAGFNSMTSFYRVFKKYTGMTPNRYKKEMEKKSPHF